MPSRSRARQMPSVPRTTRPSPSAGPKPLSRRWSRRKAERTSASFGWRAARHRDRPPSGRRGTGRAARRSDAQANAEDTRSSSALHSTASASNGSPPSWPGLGRPSTPSRGAGANDVDGRAKPGHDGTAGTNDDKHGGGTVRSRCTACIRHNPCGVETSNASPGAVAAKPCRRAHAAVRPNASSSNAASAVDKYPVLPSADDRCQKAKQAAGSGAKIEQARAPRKAIRQPPCQRNAACGVVERFAQREPVRVEPFRHPPRACANFPACVCQLGKAWPTCQAASAMS